jgi:2-iminobutanoate/2-iminopropanoate deaminase
MKTVIHSDRAPEAVGPYSHAIRAGHLVFTSGQLPIDPASGKLAEGGIKEQTRQVMENLRAILEAAGSDFSKVLKVTVYLDEMKSFAQFNEVYSEFFPSEQPARSAFQVAALPLGAMVEVDMIAHVG